MDAGPAAAVSRLALPCQGRGLRSLRGGPLLHVASWQPKMGRGAATVVKCGPLAATGPFPEARGSQARCSTLATQRLPAPLSDSVTARIALNGSALMQAHAQLDLWVS